MNSNVSNLNLKYSTIRVYSNTPNRMALGILHAYMKMFPQTTLKDLKKSFPSKLNSDSGLEQLFIPIDKMVDEPKWNMYFREDEELLCFSDGTKVAVASQWSNASLECLSNHAKEFGIDMANFEFGEKYDKCGFRLECVTASDKAETQEKGDHVQKPTPAPLADEQTPTSKTLNEDKPNNKKNNTKMEKSKETTEKDDESCARTVCAAETF